MKGTVDTEGKAQGTHHQVSLQESLGQKLPKG